ncbi:MAG TPA: HD-GYP domain-containing protein [Syntrophomonadaceae bacterium]|nr:HD-GYP domain-containing protein [Syntrophomonadaceae bacterium]
MRVRKQEAVFILFSVAVIAVLLFLTVEVGREAALISLPASIPDYSRWFGIPVWCLLLFSILFWVCKKILDLHARCRNLSRECEAVKLEYEKTKQEINRLYSAAIRSLAATLEARDEEMLGNHLGRVAGYSLALARELGLSPEEIKEIYCASMLHDIGKIGISEAILNKPGGLNSEEMEKIRRHPEIGTRIVEKLLNKEGILCSILHHHEFYDGTGYPSGLAKQEIPLGARIISIADAYDAMTSNRPYRRAFTHEQAVVELIRNAGKQFDPYLIMRFLEIVERGELKALEESLPSFVYAHPTECKAPVH